MRPHPDDFNSALFLEDLINQPMLDTDASGIGAAKISNQFFVRRWILKRILLENTQKNFGGLTQSGTRDTFGVFLSLACEIKLPPYHLSDFLHLLNEVRRPF